MVLVDNLTAYRKQDDISGPYFWGAYKNGDVRMFNKEPQKSEYVLEYIVDIDFYGQHKWHFLTLYKMDGYGGHTVDPRKMLDFESRCGYDRGPKFSVLIRYMMGV